MDSLILPIPLISNGLAVNTPSTVPGEIYRDCRMKALLNTLCLTIAVLLGGAGEGWSKEPSPTKNMKSL